MGAGGGGDINLMDRVMGGGLPCDWGEGEEGYKEQCPESCPAVGGKMKGTVMAVGWRRADW